MSLEDVQMFRLGGLLERDKGHGMIIYINKYIVYQKARYLVLALVGLLPPICDNV